MKRIYIVHPNFYDTLSSHKMIYHIFQSVSELQRNKIFIPLNLNEFHQSVEVFYQKEIQIKNNCLYFRDEFKSVVYSAEIENGIMLINDIDNPFYLLMKRLYRYLIVEEIENL